jgi:hypothetical protein
MEAQKRFPEGPKAGQRVGSVAKAIHVKSFQLGSVAPVELPRSELVFPGGGGRKVVVNADDFAAMELGTPSGKVEVKLNVRGIALDIRPLLFFERWAL